MTVDSSSTNSHSVNEVLCTGEDSPSPVDILHRQCMGASETCALL